MREERAIDWTRRFSDHQEDWILRMLFPYKDGTYIEIGVWDATALSNTYIFYEMGWKGLLVEPIPQWARMVKGKRPKDIMVTKAISNASGKITMYINSARSSLSEDWAGLFGSYKPIQVEAIRMDELMPKYPEFMTPDFVSLDVEGHEEQVLESIDWNTFKPTVYCIEAVNYDPELVRIHKKWEHYFLDNGYKLVCHNLHNRFYGRIDNAELWSQVAKWKLEE